MSDLPSDVVVVSPRRTAEDRAVERELCAAGVAVRLVGDAAGALSAIAEARPEVVVLSPSTNEPAADWQTVADLREGGYAGAILVVGQSSEPASAVRALERGADDYVAAWCDPAELVARVRALARRAAANGAAAFSQELGGLALDLRHGVVRADGVEVGLTRREADLLEYLVRHAGRPVTRAELAAQIWHSTAGGSSTNVVDVYVSYLRRKLGAVGRQSLIRSVRGVGYELVAQARPVDPVSSGR